jgi:hypothetical protein
MDDDGSSVSSPARAIGVGLLERLDGKEAAVLDDYPVEIEETNPRRVVLVMRMLRLIVRGTTLDEARALAAAAVDFRIRGADVSIFRVCSAESHVISGDRSDGGAQAAPAAGGPLRP